eukprot:1229078-Pleurochrysis_carterae.AAC.1
MHRSTLFDGRARARLNREAEVDKLKLSVLRRGLVDEVVELDIAVHKAALLEEQAAEATPLRNAVASSTMRGAASCYHRAYDL